MAGTYAHIILAATLCRNESLSRKFPTAIRQALKNHRPFCKFGAIGPDCPYVVGSTGATQFANFMHYLRTADFVRYAIPKICEMNFGSSDARACIAWIFGYTAHLVTDMTMQGTPGIAKAGSHSSINSLYAV